MKHVVVWDPDAASDVDAAWARVSDSERQQIEAAIEAAHQSLAVGGLALGESRQSLTERVTFFSPLSIFFRVDRLRSLVRVYAVIVWRAR